MKLTDNNDINHKYDNNGNISIEKINSEKAETTWDEYRLWY